MTETAETAYVPNLDAMSRDALWSFWAIHNRGRRSRDLFPAGGKGTRKATRDLANYASNKAAAMYCRLAGDIEGATMYESICDSIYTKLPAFARTW